MTDSPIDTVIVDGVPVSKASMRSYAKDFGRIRVPNVAYVTSRNLNDTGGFDIGGLCYDKDSADTTTAHDGIGVIVDAVGTRFKLVASTSIHFYAIKMGISTAPANTDTAIIPMRAMVGFTRYMIRTIYLSHASGDISTGTFGIFSAAGGAGVQFIAPGTPFTINTAADNTGNNAQTLTVVNTGIYTLRFVDVPNLFFRIGTAVAGRTVDCTIMGLALP